LRWTIGAAPRARRATGFNMRLLYSDAVHAPTNVEQQLHAEFVDMDRLFAEADFISLHVPLMPETPGVNPGLVNRTDVILAPHIASCSIETRTKMPIMAAQNVIAAFEGKRPPNALNPELVEGT
jgi:glyoxylate reductase